MTREQLLVGETIQEIRQARKLTQDQLATATGLKRLTISQIETDYRGVSSVNLAALATALDVPVSAIHLLSDRSGDKLVKDLQKLARQALGLKLKRQTAVSSE